MHGRRTFMKRLPLGMRFVEALFRLSPTMSIVNMSLDQIEKSQTVVLPKNPLTDFLLGGMQKGVKVEERTIKGPGGHLLLRIYTPQHAASGPRPLVVYFHGGGWVLGSVSMGDWMCSTVARDVDAVVVSVDYRLAPKYKFPTGLEDCYAALVWSSENAASLDADARRIGVMGESAGGNLAAVVCLLAKERGGPRIRHQALLYPATDGSMSTESYQVYEDAIILSAADVRTFYRHYLEPDTDPVDWRISPLHAVDHSGLPPATIAVAGHDPLHDEGILYAEELTKLGVPVTLKEYPAMPHGFANFPHLGRDAKPAFIEITQAQRVAFYG
jgi:acetyl esterase